MAWSAKIQSGTGGTQGFNEFETVYDPSSQTSYKLKYGFSMGNQAPQILYHTPDNGSPVPVSATGANRLIFLTIDVPKQTGWDTIANSISALARLVDGPHSQAVRAQTTGDANKIRVAIKPDGATYTTYFDVLHGFIDSSQAFSSSAAMINTMAQNITIALTCAPYGYGDSFTLRNDLPSSPHFIVDTNADGLADGWTKVGTTTCALDTSRYLIGGQAQKFTTDASSTHGIYSATVTASSSSTIAAKIFVSIDNKDKTSVVLRDGSGNVIQSKVLEANDATGVATRTHIGSDGSTWYEINLSGTNSAAADCYLIIQRSSTNATQASNVWLDGAYLKIGTSTVPVGWAGAHTLTNNANNYLDFWGIPGDMPALVRYRLTDTTNKSLILGKRSDGMQLATKVRYLIQNTYFANGSTWVTSSNYTRASADAETSDPYTATYSGDDGVTTANAIGETIWKMYVVARASGTDNGLYAQWSPDSYYYTDTNTATATTANTWELWDLGIINPIGKVIKTDPIGDIIFSTFYLRLVSVIPSSGTVDVDYVILMPISEEHMVAEKTPGLIAGDFRAVFRYLGLTVPSYLESWRGSLWTVEAGNKMTRIVYHDYSTLTTNAVTAGDTMGVTTTVIPRTSHLLGTK